MKLSALVDRISGEGADAWLTHYAAQAAVARGESAVVLSVGDPDLDTPVAVVDRAIEALRGGDTHYTSAGGRDTLRAAIADLHTRRTGQHVEANQVAVLSGAQNALFVASLCLGGAGDEVIALDPMYTTYPATMEVCGAKLVRVQQRADQDFRFNAQAFREAVSPRTRVALITTPNNPTGVTLTADDWAVIGELAEKHDFWIVADEVYAGIAQHGHVPGVAATLSHRVITVGSLSKSHAMTGWRVGWLVAPREVIVAVEALTLCMLFGLPGFIQEAAVKAIGMSDMAENTMRQYCTQRAQLMASLLSDLPNIQFKLPDAGMFLLLDVRQTGLSSGDFMRGLYAQEKVSVVDGAAFGRATEGFVRLSFATTPELIREGCLRIRRFCAGLSHS